VRATMASEPEPEPDAGAELPSVVGGVMNVVDLDHEEDMTPSLKPLAGLVHAVTAHTLPPRRPRRELADAPRLHSPAPTNAAHPSFCLSHSRCRTAVAATAALHCT
jgi:hypothetical protein